MKKTCDYCGNYLSDTDEVCPHCGAPNPNLKRAGEGVPATIEALRAFCEKHDMPLERMRFFIGEDCREARAFGIYQDEEGMFVVYKNKADGSRAVRYRGKDEAYAVNELYQKLQSEVLNQRQHQVETRSAPPRQETYFNRKEKDKKRKRKIWLIVGVVVLLLIIGALLDDSPATGYYNYGGNHYYSQSGDWYFFDNALNSWVATEVDDQLGQHYQDYYDSGAYEYGSDYSDWGDSEYASDYSYSSDWGSSSDDDWDSDWDDDDWDYDYDDWDSGYSDWDSDW